MKFINPEIEQALIGRMLWSEPAAIAKLNFCEEDFSEPFHWQTYQEIQAGKRLFDYSGTDRYAYLRSVADVWSIPIIPGADDYADILKELARKRNIWRTCTAAIERLETTDSSEILGYLNAGINQTATNGAVKSRAEIRKEIIAGLELPKACYATGIKNLDTAMGGGIYEGYTYAFCGAEKAGKTTLAHTISHQLPCKHLYVAMEMGAVQIEQRNLARDLHINSLKFLEQPDGLKNKVETARPNDNVYYYDAPGATVEEITHNIGMSIIRHGIKGFIIDYWQLVSGQQKGESEEKHLRHVAQSLANFARKQKVWCILLAQMNKDGQLFGGNGLRKACDQLYMIESCIGQIEHGRWLRMDASRYTFKADIGSEQRPSLSLNTKSGPYFEELQITF